MLITAAFAALFGLAFGSFANVVIYRVPLGGSLMHPPSTCPSCRIAIRSLDNIPVLSWVLLRGRCRHCRERISVRYPIVELQCAGLAGAAMLGRPIYEGVFVAAACWVLVVLAWIDVDHKRVPNAIVLPASGVAAVAIAVMGLLTAQRGRAIEALVTGVCAYLLLFVIAIVSNGGMGFGDVKLARFIGLTCGWFGWPSAAIAIFVGFVTGGLVGIALLAAGKSRKHAIAFAPMLCLGAVVGLLVGRPLARLWLG